MKVNNFLKFSARFPKISEDSPKVVRRPDKRFRTFYYILLTRVPDVGFEYFRFLKKALEMPCESCLSETAHKPFEGFF